MRASDARMRMLLLQHPQPHTTETHVSVGCAHAISHARLGCAHAAASCVSAAADARMRTTMWHASIRGSHAASAAACVSVVCGLCGMRAFEARMRLRVRMRLLHASIRIRMLFLQHVSAHY
jgi:hypothetical protein